MSNKKQFQKWFTYFDFIPPCPGSKGQWQVKEDTDAQTPICAVPDPIGGERDSDGLNPRHRANESFQTEIPQRTRCNRRRRRQSVELKQNQ